MGIKLISTQETLGGGTLKAQQLDHIFKFWLHEVSCHRDILPASTARWRSLALLHALVASGPGAHGWNLLSHFLFD
jgi:hypothetical protein